MTRTEKIKEIIGNPYKGVPPHEIHELLELVEVMAEALKFYAKYSPQNSLDGEEGMPTAIRAKEALAKYKEWNEVV